MGSDMPDCLNEQRIAEITSVGIPLTDAERLHLDRCADCRTAVESAEENDSLLRETRSALQASLADRRIDREDEIEWHSDSIPGVRLERIVASGGQGVLFSAVAADGRRVAVKIPRRAATKSTLRLEREAIIIGRLAHENIVAIVDSGISPLGAYVVTEWIDGRDLLTFAAEDRPDAAKIAEIFRKIVDAVAHAHAAGIIHRDLKPANVLVDRNAGPHVIDFGIASTTANAVDDLRRATETGEFVGTLTYCAPEVWRTPNAVDARADVYSLGVMLQKVVGAALGVPENLEGRALAAIAEKAQSLEPAARFATAADLRSALREIHGTFARMTRPSSTPAPRLVAAALIGILILAAVALILRPEDTEDPRSETSPSIVDLVDDALLRESESGMPPSVPLRTLLPELEVELGASASEKNGGVLFETIGKTYFSIGLVDESVGYFKDAVERYRTVGEPARRDLARALGRLGRAQIDIGVDGSEAALRESLEIRRALREPSQAEIAQSLGALGCAIATRYREPDPAAGRGLIMEALALFRSLPGAPSPGFAQTLRDLAAIDGEKDADAAVALLREAVQTSEATRPFDELDRFYSLTALAAALPRVGRFDKAAVVLQEAADSARRLNGPDRAEFILRSFSRLHWSKGDYATSEAFAARALSAALARREHEFPNDADAIRSLVARLDGPPEALARAIVDGFALLKKFVGPMSYETAQWMSGVATLQKSMGRIDVAESLFRSALEFRCPHFGDDCPIRVGVMLELAKVLAETGRKKDAKPLIDDVVRTVRRTGNAETPFGREAITLQKELESP